MVVIKATTTNTRRDVTVAVNTEAPWKKYLGMQPHLTMKEIELHRLLSCKTPESAILKALDRRQKF